MIDLQRAEHVGDVNAEHLRLGAIDVEIDLRRRVLEQREHLRQARCLRGLCHHGGGRFQQRLRTAGGAVLDHHPNAAGIADAGDGRRLNDQDQSASWKPANRLNSSAGDAGGRLFGITSTLVPGLERQKDCA